MTGKGKRIDCLPEGSNSVCDVFDMRCSYHFQVKITKCTEGGAMSFVLYIQLLLSPALNQIYLKID